MSTREGGGIFLEVQLRTRAGPHSASRDVHPKMLPQYVLEHYRRAVVSLMRADILEWLEDPAGRGCAAVGSRPLAPLKWMVEGTCALDMGSSGAEKSALTASEGAGRAEAQAMAIHSRPRRTLDSRLKTVDEMGGRAKSLNV